MAAAQGVARLRVRFADHPKRHHIRLDTGHACFGLDENFVEAPTLGGRQLIVVDEIGRGTSTEDGTALAHAVLRTLADSAAGPLCLFTTHFFELTRMEGDEKASLANFHVDALARDGALTLLYEVKPGASAASFGVECAALAGFPAAVVADAARRAKAAEAAAVA